MARAPVKDEFHPKNPKKYVGSYPIIYRSSWEMSMMREFDTNRFVLQWASESLSIPYRHPFLGTTKMYVPDFWVVYIDRNNRKWVEIIEVKPSKEDPEYQPKLLRNGKYERISKRTRLVQEINRAKWTAAREFCRRKGIVFRVMTEVQMFTYKK